MASLTVMPKVMRGVLLKLIAHTRVDPGDARTSESIHFWGVFWFIGVKVASFPSLSDNPLRRLTQTQEPFPIFIIINIGDNQDSH